MGYKKIELVEYDAKAKADWIYYPATRTYPEEGEEYPEELFFDFISFDINSNAILEFFFYEDTRFSKTNFVEDNKINKTKFLNVLPLVKHQLSLYDSLGEIIKQVEPDTDFYKKTMESFKKELVKLVNEDNLLEDIFDTIKVVESRTVFEYKKKVRDEEY